MEKIRKIHIFATEIRKIMKKLFSSLMVLLGLGANTACSQQLFQDANVEDFAQLTDSSGVQILDVRTAEEFAEGHLRNAVNIDVKQSSFKDEALKRLDRNRRVAVYCRSGRRSVTAANILVQNGFQVTNLLGGILAWQKAGKEVTTETKEIDTFTTKSGKTIKFYTLMHASIRIVFEGKEIEIDPVRKLGNRTIDYTAVPKADYIFVTHEHGDHFDKEAIATLTNDKTQFITNTRCAGMIGYGKVMKNGDQLQVDDIHVEAVPAYNITEGHQQFHPKGRDNGYVLTIDGLRIYIAGDTEDIPEMASLKDIDIAFLPCNQPYTMTTDQLQKAARVIKPRVLFPYHYSQTDLSAAAEQLQKEGIDVRVRHYE